MNQPSTAKQCSCTEPSSCVLAGMIIGIILIIFLSSCGYVKVPQPSKAENLNIRPNADPMKDFRGDAKPPVVMGDPFVLSLQTGSSGASPY